MRVSAVQVMIWRGVGEKRESERIERVDGSVTVEDISRLRVWEGR